MNCRYQSHVQHYHRRHTIWSLMVQELILVTEWLGREKRLKNKLQLVSGFREGRTDRGLKV